LCIDLCGGHIAMAEDVRQTEQLTN
jgi:hypothetical protein